MPANAALYLPHDDIDLREVFADGQHHRGGDSSEYFDCLVDGHPVRFNVMAQSDIPAHLDGFAGYVRSLDEPASRADDAVMLIEHSKTVLGLVAECEFDENHELWQCLFTVTDRWDGFVFAFDSILLPNGAVIVGPLRDDS
ncbi:MAG: hypothetical protein AAGE65_05035 [Planctomycetota bacterium]